MRRMDIANNIHDPFSLKQEGFFLKDEVKEKHYKLLYFRRPLFGNDDHLRLCTTLGAGV